MNGLEVNRSADSAARDDARTAANADARDGKSRHSQEDRSAATREKLIEGAYRILREFGHAGLRSANISTASGISRGGLLHHYATKELLIAAVYEWLTDRMEAASVANIAAATDDRLLAAIVDDATERFFGDEYRVALDILIASREAAVPADGSSGAEPRRRFEAHVAWAGRIAQTGARPDAALQAASFLWFMVRGLAVRRFVSDNSEHDRRVVAFSIEMLEKWLHANGR